MSKDFNDFIAKENASVDMRFFIIPNGNNEYDTFSDCIKNIPDESIKEEASTIKHNPIKDLEMSDIEFNNKAMGKKMNTADQNEESEEKIFSLDKNILYTFTSEEKAQDLQKKNKINFQRLYFKEYNSKFKQFITEYANNLLRKHLLCGKIQKPRVSLLKFNPKKKKKDKNKFLSFTMKKMFCFHKRKNKKIIKRILSFIKKFDCNKKYEYIKSFLSLKIGDAIQKFEESEKFKEFISDTKIISLDKEIKLQAGFSILEKNAYEKMIKMQCGV
jgi:hypothetical protein